MKLSPLQLHEYFVTEFHFTLNSSFDPNLDTQLVLDELDAVTDCKLMNDDLRRWVVTLELKYQPAVETNTPYIFSLGIVGIFEVMQDFEEAKINRIIRTNGPSILFGVAREIVREQTARGPAGALILPSPSFLPDEPIEPSVKPS